MVTKRLIVDNMSSKAYEFGKDFYGKVNLRKDKDSNEIEITGPSFNFSNKSEVRKFIMNLKSALKEWYKI